MIAFLGLRHGHIFTLYNEALNNPYFTICGAYEPNAEARKIAENNGVVCNYETLDQILGDSAQLMLTAGNNAGIIADVSYAIPDGVEFALPYYWQFYIWGTKGTLRFSLGEERAKYFLVGDAAPRILKEEQPQTDYLTDFYRLINGEKDVILPMQDVFNATNKTLEIQEFADKNCQREEICFR